MKVILSMLFALLFAFSAAACAPKGKSVRRSSRIGWTGCIPAMRRASKWKFRERKSMRRLRITPPRKEFADRLAKGETTLAFSDFAGAEKIAYPSPPFTLSDAEGCDPEIGDVTIYKPWGNIAIFTAIRRAILPTSSISARSKGTGSEFLRRRAEILP